MSLRVFNPYLDIPKDPTKGPPAIPNRPLFLKLLTIMMINSDMWNSAVANLTSMKKAKRAASPPPKSDLISSSSLPRRGLISDTTVPNGVKISDDQNAPVGRKHNFFSCYNSGQFGYDQTIAAFGVAGCAVVTNLLVEGVRVYVSPTWYEPSHGSGKLYLTLTKYAPKFLANAECVFLASWLPTYVCQAEKDTQTQGGKLAIYGNDVGSLTNGDKTMELKIDPNDCAGNVRCDDPPTTDIPPFTTPPKGGEP